ncbi:MAG: hypothetical protein AM326_10965 [Candidatus Thorarchaeota archaeon SMTZ-45]|nr:MAG: hypothetical protein AM326_10965 [Candidatus Thorarchaeota archaeon SMTZ-45]
MPPSLTEQLNTMYTTTWYLRWRTVVDQIFDATPFWYTIKKKGKMSTQSGGRSIEIPLQYAKNETVRFIGRGGTVDISATDPLTVVHWNWKYLTGHIVRYFADFQMNRGKAQLIKKVNADINNLQSSLIDHMETNLFSDGTGDSGYAIDGLANIVKNDPTSSTVVGNLNQNTYSWWRNQYQDMSSYPASIHLRKRMNIMFNNCGKQGEGLTRFPDIIICAQNVHEFYESEALEISRILISDRKLADLGFGDLAYKGRPMTWSPSASDGYLYMLNTNFLEWVADPVENFTLGDWLPIINQPRDVVAHSMAVGNLVCSNRKRQGVMFSIAE